MRAFFYKPTLQEQNHPIWFFVGLFFFFLRERERLVDRAVKTVDTCDYSPRKGMAAVWTSAVSSRTPKLSCPRTFLNGKCTHQVSGELQPHALVWRRSLFEKDNNTALRQGGDERFPSNAWHPSTTFPKRLPAVPILPDSNTKALVQTLDTSYLYPITSSSFG